MRGSGRAAVGLTLAAWKDLNARTEDSLDTQETTPNTPPTDATDQHPYQSHTCFGFHRTHRAGAYGRWRIWRNAHSLGQRPEHVQTDYERRRFLNQTHAVTSIATLGTIQPALDLA